MKPLVSAIGRLGGGDFTARVDTRRSDEIARLGSSFNSMAEGLQRANAELEGWTRTLQCRVDEKTRELEAAQDHIVRSERLACLGRLAAVVAHELNNPLAGVQVYVRRARRALAKDEAPGLERSHEIGEWMETVDREIGRCGRIVQDLLSFSRQRAPHRAPTDFNDVIRRSTRLLGHKLDLEEIDLTLRLDESLAPIVADSDQVQQALLAVLINAVEAMPRGGILDVASRAHVGGGVEIEVRDSGGGIPPDVMPHILEPFFTTKPEGQGTGLGLSSMYGIVTRHGGRLDIDSVPGQGTSVTMFFPPAPAEEASEAGNQPESPDATNVTR
jgi:two-component system NtrC family sensor kinase